MRDLAGSRPMVLIEGTEGDYDDFAQAVLLSTGGQTVVLLVIGGLAGHGFSVASLIDVRTPEMRARLAGTLRDMANKVEFIEPDGTSFTVVDRG